MLLQTSFWGSSGENINSREKLKSTEFIESPALDGSHKDHRGHLQALQGTSPKIPPQTHFCAAPLPTPAFNVPKINPVLPQPLSPGPLPQLPDPSGSARAHTELFPNLEHPHTLQFTRGCAWGEQHRLWDFYVLEPPWESSTHLHNGFEPPHTHTLSCQGRDPNSKIIPSKAAFLSPLCVSSP